jgi:hypothetical protein
VSRRLPAPRRQCARPAAARPAHAAAPPPPPRAAGAAEWRVAFRVERKWINLLIGWTSTADTEETMSRALYFESKEAAVAHAEKAGWEYEVIEHAPAVRGVEGRPKRFVGYGDNYSFKRGGVPTGGLRSEQAAAAAPAAAAAAGGKKKKAAA